VLDSNSQGASSAYTPRTRTPWMLAAQLFEVVYLANLRMGELRQMQGHLADARRYMERAVEARPSSREARRVLSELPSE